ncbi:general transcription factor II-I repeat domain-containing protein 2-like [Sipha flava]|uniref:General transcription factor II-I repeat domain-containing protein 2-like n=1 Tax=Sipha flava TaxID=143950 RepID=A0A8B8FK36_9HEMI|nr:general transcription factor II-I repeat domain-containing protein 2-like [Sipha flava]
MFTEIPQENEATVKVSYVLSELIAKHSKPFTEAYSLSDQIKIKISSFEYFSIACDEKVPITAQLAMFFCASLMEINFFEELFVSVHELLKKYELPLVKLSSVTTDGAPSMMGKNKGFIERLRKKIISRDLNQRQFSSFLNDLESEYSGLPYLTEVRWLSRSTILERFWKIKDAIQIFLVSKEQDVSTLSDPMHLSNLNLKLQGKDQIIRAINDHINAFKFLKVASFNNISPKIEKLVKEKRYQTSPKRIINMFHMPDLHAPKAG